MTESPAFDVVANATFVEESSDPITPNPMDLIEDPEAQEEAHRFALSFGGKDKGKEKKPKKEKAPRPTPPKPRAGALKKIGRAHV